MKITVIRGNEKKELNYDKPIKLSDAIIDSGFDFDMPCGGKGICGKCTVGLRETEKAIRNVKACSTIISCDSEVIIPDKKITGVTESGFMQLEKKNASGFGAAVDIGTTTVACKIYSYPEFSL